MGPSQRVKSAEAMLTLNKHCLFELQHGTQDVSGGATQLTFASFDQRSLSRLELRDSICDSDANGVLGTFVSVLNMDKYNKGSSSKS